MIKFLVLCSFIVSAFGATSEMENHLRELNKKSLEQGWSFQIGPTKPYQIYLEKGITATTGLKLPKEWKKSAKFKNVKARTDLPKKFSIADIKGGMPAIRDQGACGSCWAFGITGVLEIASYVKNGKEVDLAEQEILSCNKQRYSCNGGYFDAHDYQVNPGQALEGDFPYKAADLKCKKGLNHVEKIASWYYIGGEDGTPTTDQIKTVMYETHRPVAVAVAADDPFMSYVSGIFGKNKSGCNHDQLNHMVVIYGWNDEEDPANGYWYMRNSWGDSWGEDGNMRITYECSGIASLATAVDYQ